MKIKSAGEWALEQKLKEESIDELVRRLNSPYVLPSPAIQAGLVSVTYEDIYAALEKTSQPNVKETEPVKEPEPKASVQSKN